LVTTSPNLNAKQKPHRVTDLKKIAMAFSHTRVTKYE